MNTKHWSFQALPEITHDFDVIEHLKSAVQLPDRLAILLWQRGIHTFDHAKDFFRPSLESLHDPFLMLDMPQAIERLSLALDRQEKIVVFGDYDVDGTTAVALVYGFLSKLTTQLDFYVPDRYKEGYGISKQGIEWAVSQGITLMIALDCGIKAIQEVEYARTLGLDMIICDHHEPGETIPKAVAVLDPKRSDCPYPFKELSGNGVGFKLMQALCMHRSIPLDELWPFLDLCVVSIGADIVPIIGENRILAFYGLKKLNESACIGLSALKKVAGFTEPMTIENVVFILGPRINAAGRIFHAKAAVELLLSQNFDDAWAMAQEIQAYNMQRRELDSSITEEAIRMIQEDAWLSNEAQSTVLYNPQWHKGVIGIVASRCIEKVYRPTIILTQSHDVAAGSARSVEGFDLYAALEACSSWLIQFGGHTHAAGMTILPENIPGFRQAFDEEVKRRLEEENRVPKVRIDLSLTLADITPKFFRIMRQMGPFGPKNMQPVFMTQNLKLVNPPVILKEKHLKLQVMEESSGTSFVALGFGMAEDFYERLLKNESFALTYTIDENNFRGQVSLQLMIKDIKWKDDFHQLTNLTQIEYSFN